MSHVFEIPREAVEDVNSMFLTALMANQDRIGKANNGLAYIVGRLIKPGVAEELGGYGFGNETNLRGWNYADIARVKYDATVAHGIRSGLVLERGLEVPQGEIPLFPGSMIDRETGLIVASTGSYGLVDEQLSTMAIERILGWREALRLNAACANPQA